YGLATHAAHVDAPKTSTAIIAAAMISVGCAEIMYLTGCTCDSSMVRNKLSNCACAPRLKLKPNQVQVIAPTRLTKSRKQTVLSASASRRCGIRNLPGFSHS